MQAHMKQNPQRILELWFDQTNSLWKPLDQRAPEVANIGYLADISNNIKSDTSTKTGAKDIQTNVVGTVKSMAKASTEDIESDLGQKEAIHTSTSEFEPQNWSI